MFMIQKFGLIALLTAGCLSTPIAGAGAEEVFLPRDAGLVNLRDFGAAGDGRTDDTGRPAQSGAGEPERPQNPPFPCRNISRE